MRLREVSMTAVVVVGLLAPGMAARAEDMIVVAARGIGLHPGEKIDAGRPLVLAEGQHVTLIAINGVTLKLDGPYDKAPSAAGGGTNVAAALGAFLTQQNDRTTEAGVTRAGVGAATLPRPWVLDISRTGNVCLAEGQPAVFWRPSNVKEATLKMAPADRTWRAEATWPQGASELTAASDVPVHGNAVYFVALDNGEESAITINPVPAGLDNDSVVAAWLVNQGCDAQAEALLRRGQ
jgi:hypothetical protein